VVLPELAEQQLSPPGVSNIRQDLAGFDKLFDLPAPRLQVAATFAPGASPWLAAGEEVLDAEMIHAVAPAAGEHCLTSSEVTQLHAARQTAAARQVTVVAGSGDIGAVGEPCTVSSANFTPVREVSLPASDPLVLAAGGTGLAASHTTGIYRGETAWGLPYGDPGSTFQASGGGTSASTPFWAGIIALANQYAGHDLGFVDPALYAIARGPWYHAAFHDITKGNNTVKFPPKTFRGYRAGPGWDPVTGLGSPNAQVLIPCSPGRPLAPSPVS
jgi:subtilase family serine protease